MNDKQGPVKDAIRWVFGWIDWIFYVVLGWIYQIFFDISTVELLTGETIRNFCSRIQLILGVFMVFKISISILQAIVDPDKISDKNNGFSAYIKRIVICLIMLTVLIPRHIPNAKTEYEIQINNNGLLFGTLYSLQGRIMRNNTLGKLILGSNNDIISTADSTEEQVKKMNDLGTNFTSTIIRSFLKETSNCSGEADGDGVKILKDENADAKAILNNHINETCGSLSKGYYYAIEYYPIIGGIVALAFTIILVGFSIDIAVRSVKIAVLRLLAPIPIISYLDPNQEKKGAFANWVKILVSTYLDLFIRLALIYFVIFLIEDIRANGLAGYNGNDGNGPFVFIVICIGLYFFAKQAPKFIKDVLGIQNSMSNIGLGSILGGTAMAMGGGGLAGFAYGAMNGAKMQADGQAQGKPAPLGASWSSNRDLMEKIKTGDKDAQGGFWGRTNDMLNYKTRDTAASKLGLGAKDFARASYIEGYYDDKQRAAEMELRNAQSALNAFGNGGAKMDKAAFLNQRGYAADSSEGNAAYNSYSQQYDAAYKRVSLAQQDVDKFTAAHAKADKDKTRMDKERTAMHLEPRISDIERDHLFDSKSNGKIESTLGRIEDAIHYREPLSVVTDKDTGLAKGVSGEPTNDTADYKYEKNRKGYSGTIDETTFLGALPRGGNNGGPGGPGGPNGHH